MKFYCKQGHPFQREKRPEKCPTCGDKDVYFDDIIEEFAVIPKEAWEKLAKS